MIQRVEAALKIAYQYGQTDGARHKAWVIDQMVRELIGDRYTSWVHLYQDGDEGPDTYEWDQGIAP